MKTEERAVVPKKLAKLEGIHSISAVVKWRFCYFHDVAKPLFLDCFTFICSSQDTGYHIRKTLKYCSYYSELDPSLVWTHTTKMFATKETDGHLEGLPQPEQYLGRLNIFPLEMVNTFEVSENLCDVYYLYMHIHMYIYIRVYIYIHINYVCVFGIENMWVEPLFSELFLNKFDSS